MGSKRLVRVLRLYHLLHAGGSYDCASFAQTLECSCRTVYRDLNLLRVSGISVRFDEAHDTYSTDILPDAALDESALAAIIVAAIHSPLAKRGRMGRRISESLQTLARRASPRLRDAVANLLRSLADSGGTSTDEVCMGWVNGVEKDNEKTAAR